MIKIKTTYKGYLRELYIGKLVQTVEMNEYGQQQDLDEFVDVVSKNETLVIRPAKDVCNTNDCTEPFKQTKELTETCRAIFKKNPLINFVVFTNGKIKPTGFTRIKNVLYVVKIPSKRVNALGGSVNANVWKWLAKANARFVFQVYDADELDEISMLVNEYNIKTSMIYIESFNNHKAVVIKSLIERFNLYFNIEGELY